MGWSLNESDRLIVHLQDRKDCSNPSHQCRERRQFTSRMDLGERGIGHWESLVVNYALNEEMPP
jgi:hypothetical protein